MFSSSWTSSLTFGDVQFILYKIIADFFGMFNLSRHDAASDEFLHNFIRSSIDPLDSTVNVGFTDGIFPHVTPAAMHLDTAVCNTALEVRKPVITMGSHINPLRAIFSRENININVHFVSYLHFDMTQVVEILPQIRQEPTYST